MMMSLLLISHSVFSEDSSLLGNDFDNLDPSTSLSRNRTQVVMLGKVVNGRITIAHYNDEDLLGFGEQLGFPRDDDMGRTAGLVVNYQLHTDDGSVEIDMQNWLFTRWTGNEDNEDEQILEEVSTIQIRSRQFIDGNDNRWVIIGFSFTNQIERPFLMAFLQGFVHDINSNSATRWNVNRDGNSINLGGIFGVGGKYDILEHRSVTISATGELEVQPNTSFLDYGNVRVRASLELRWAAWQTTETPLLRVRFFAEQIQYFNGDRGGVVGGELFLGFSLGRFFVEPGLSVTRWVSRYDDVYEGGESWNMAIFIRVTVAQDRGDRDRYLFEEGDDLD